jgi:hypothetical protein
MDLATASQYIQGSLDRMRISYSKPVFDEWAILAVPAKSAGVVAYTGPRPEAFRRNFIDDVQPLRARTAGQELAEGDIEFVSDASDTRYDALMKIGPASFLVLNHTGKSLAEIRADTRWLAAQAVLFELTEKFRADPLQV